MNDTIAAIASGMTASGIGIIRISGPEAFAVLKRIFRPKKPSDPEAYKAGTIHYGHVFDPGNHDEIIDECLIMAMRSPHTFTTEDTVEINCHGGPFVMRKILRAVTENGARPAEPGEFTKRAFLGGRIDLSEAEAVMDVISARSDDALKSSLLQLSGSVREKIMDLREKIMDKLAYIEAALDDPEHMDLEGFPEEILRDLAPVRNEISRLLRTFGEGRVIREGILTVIVGRPNAGKSTLLNALTGEDRAIVTDIEGTTRDILEEKVSLGGITLRVIDTAGIREARDRIEQIGVERARLYAGQADLLLALIDSGRPLDENDIEILKLIRGRKAIILLNKSDLETEVTEEDLQEVLRKIREDGEAENEALHVIHENGEEINRDESGSMSSGVDSGTEEVQVIRISAKEMTGIEELEEKIREMFFSGRLSFGEETIITNTRHFDALKRASQSLSLVEESVNSGLPEDFFSIDLMDAYRALSEIVGEEVSDDLVDTIFSKFCMGK